MCSLDEDFLVDSEHPTVQRIITGLEEFQRIYTVFHRYASIFICVAGVLVNVVHILVLSRPRLRRCAVNAVLTAVAVCDVVIMTSYTIYLFRFRIFQTEGGYSYAWMVFLKSHVSVSVALHAITLYMGAALAFIRWRALGNIQSRWLLPVTAWNMFFMVSVAIAVLTIPTFVLHHIYLVDSTETSTSIAEGMAGPSEGLYSLEFAHLPCALYRFNLWIVAIVMKAAPCALLLWFTIALVLKLRATDEKRHHLYSKSFRKHIKKTTVPDRTTYMLLILLAVFLVTELPQGILALFNGMSTSYVYKSIYDNVGELLDMLSLVNCSMDFILYCCMSSRYRQTFGHMLIRVESWVRNQWYPGKDGERCARTIRRAHRVELTDDPSFSRVHCDGSCPPDAVDV
ncbi:unnamed protein product, partial [Mesorhabditis belari]|uniref:G-protein coupled receptors family 1 profile domain-containing protein n=1 Tax=Mesorhabditis belari TaxID=2138241 RepID=A0AAF3EEX4_9BILA